jgi:tetratricopeptide (TPR) repeat protein
MLEEYINGKINEAQDFLQNDTNEALKIYDEILEIDPENIDALNGMGSAYIKLDQLDTADEYFDKSLLICENSSAFLNKGIIWKHRNNNEKALYYYDKALEINPNLENIINILKDELITEEINLTPFNEKANELIKQGIILKNENKLWDSLDTLTQAIAADPSCEEEVNKLIDEIKTSLNHELSYIDEKYNADNKIDRIKMQALRVLVKDNDTEKALTLMDIALELDKDDLNTLNHKGGVFFIQSNYQKALECFDECLRIDKNYYCALFNKALVLRIMNKLTSALTCFNELLKIPQFHQKVKPYQLEILDKLKQNPIP